jgi:hypothetical protein
MNAAGSITSVRHVLPSNGITNANGVAHYAMPPTGPAGLVGLYSPRMERFADGDSIQNLADLSGSGNDIAQSTASKRPTLDENGALFDAVDDYIGASSIHKPTAALSVAAWFKCGASNALRFIVSHGDTGYEGYYLSQNSNGTFRFHCGDGSGDAKAESTTAAAANAEVFVVGTWDGSDLRIYVDGAEENSASFSGPISYGASLGDGFMLGQSEGFTASRYWDGHIFDAAIYNRALSADEVAAMNRWQR